MKVYVLQHAYELYGSDDIKLIGVYASREKADEARQRAQHLPGFVKHPDSFSIDAYELGHDHWTDGFVTEVERSGSSTSNEQAA